MLGSPVSDPVIKDWRDVFNIVGMIVGLLGLILTILAAKAGQRAAERAKTAADQARDAANQTRSRLFYVDAVGHLAEAVTIMEEVQRHHRERAWHVVLDRYVAIKKLLAAVQTTEAVSGSHKSDLLTAIVQFNIIIREVERAVHDGSGNNLDAARLNDVVMMQMDRMNQIRADVRKAGSDT
jgi:hypothetical protein